jgi:hypothetical protein
MKDGAQQADSLRVGGALKTRRIDDDNYVTIRVRASRTEREGGEGGG